MNRRTIALLFLVSALLALPAAAFERLDECNGHWTRWRNSYETLNVSYGENQFSTPEWRNSLEAARAGWNLHAPGSNFRIYFREDPWAIGLLGDTRDDLVIFQGQWNHGLSVKAITKHQTSDCDTWNPFDVAHYTEVDVLLQKETNSYDKSTNPVPSNHMTNTTLLLLHEFGHVMGLGHEDDVLATMNSSFPSPVGGPIGSYNEVHPLGDDARGARAAYGTAATVRDVAASAVYLASPGRAAIIPAPPPTFRNSPVTIQFTVLNRGTTDETIPIHFYLSGTREVHPSTSFYLGSATISLLYARSTTGTVTLHIPSNAPAGYQHLAWYVDPYNGIPESNEGNNGVALVDKTFINIDSAPNACFTATPDSGSAPLTVNFNAGCSNDPDADPLTYAWDFGDGGTGTGPTPSYTYYTPGTYLVTLTVTDPFAARATTSTYIRVVCSDSRFCPEEPY